MPTFVKEGQRGNQRSSRNADAPQDPLELFLNSTSSTNRDRAGHGPGRGASACRKRDRNASPSIADMVREESSTKRLSEKDWLRKYGEEQEGDEHVTSSMGVEDAVARRRTKELSRSRRRPESSEDKLFRDFQQSTKAQKQRDACLFCLDSKRCQDIRRSTFIAASEFVYLASQTARDALLPFHSLIAPVDHVSTGCHLSDDAYEDVRNFKKAYRAFLKTADARAMEACGYSKGPYKAVFVEWHIPRGRRETTEWEVAAQTHMGGGPHTTIDAIALNEEDFEAAKMVFRQEFRSMTIEIERTNKSLREIDPKIPLSRLMRAENPPPYIYVDFGLETAYLHTLEASADVSLTEKVDRRYIRSIITALLPETVQIPSNFNFEKYLETYKRDFAPFDFNRDPE